MPLIRTTVVRITKGIPLIRTTVALHSCTNNKGMPLIRTTVVYTVVSWVPWYTNIKVNVFEFIGFCW